MTVAERAESLAREVIGPMILGGPIKLQRPFGAKLAFEIGPERVIVDNALRTDVNNARLRVARAVVAVDALRDMDPSEWALAAGFNDLLQITNHELSSFATRSRHRELLDSLNQLCDRIPPPATLEQAVARHATFSRALIISRTDTLVSWWTGSDSFRGQAPPTRLLRWPGLRNVRIEDTAVPLVKMALGVPVEQNDYLTVLGRWLACTPISDLATSFRAEPRFVWTTHTVSLAASVGGTNLALRAFARATAFDDEAVDAAVAAMNKSAAALAAHPQAQAAALHFAMQLKAADSFWEQEESA